MNNKNKIREAAEKFGTPSYIFDGEELVVNYHNLKNALPDCVDVFYALKVNPNASLVKLLRSQGACTEVCSLGEMETALRAGSTPRDIIFLGPCKKDYELERAIDLEIFSIVVESESELHRISEISRSKGKSTNVSIRINPDFSSEGSPWKMGGRPTHFGIDQSRAIESFEEYLKVPHVNVIGIHVYNGTNILEARSVYENTKYILELFDELATKHDQSFRMVDVGGGMGIPYYLNQEKLDIHLFKELMVPLFSNFNEKYPDVRIIMESGRFIAGTAGHFVVAVNNIKNNHGELFAVTDGGTNCHSSAAGTGRVVRRNFPMENLSAEDDVEQFEYQVSGPLCSPDDLLARKIMLPKVSEGDLLSIQFSGAYGLTSSPGLFHSHGYPAEVLTYNGNIDLIGKRSTFEEIIDRHIIIDFEEQTSENVELVEHEPLKS